jgi:hypothetical protein
MGPPEAPKERSPDLLAQDEASGIEALPRRVQRYGSAKSRALDVADYLRAQPPAATRSEAQRLHKLGRTVAGCGEYLVFRHYFTVDQVRLHAARLCRKHLLCPLCAIRRGAKALQAYLPRYEAVRASCGLLRPFLVTLTVKDGADLRERFNHLHDSQRELWMRKHRGRGSALDGVKAAVWSYEVKRGSGSGLWHPHLHMVAMASEPPDAVELANEWHRITGDSFIVDVRPIDELDPASGFLEVFKYALKFSDMEPADTVAAHGVLAGRRLVGSAGLFRGIEIPEQLLDEPLDDLPFVDLLYRYFRSGYTLATPSWSAAVAPASAAGAQSMADRPTSLAIASP